jgi:hypothetical protein
MSEKETLTVSQKAVQDRLEDAARTLRRLPPVRVQGYFSTWPEIRRDKAELQQMEKALLRLGPPTARSITQMEEVLFIWMKWLTIEQRKVVWLRAERVRWKQICWQLGFGRTKAWGMYKLALTIIAGKTT